MTSSDAKQRGQTKSESTAVSRQRDMLLVVFSACGRIRTGNGKPILTAYFPMLTYGILGKGELFVSPPLEDCLTELTGSSTRDGTGWTDLQLSSSSVADCQALT